MDAPIDRSLFGTDARRDPFPVYQRLRGHGPVRVGDATWVLVDEADVRTTLGDPERFSSDLRDSGNPVMRDTPLVFDDPPHHTRLRRIVSRAFTPSWVTAAAPWVRHLVDDQLDRLGPGPGDVIAGFCRPLPTRVIGRLLGIADDGHEQLARWSDDRAFVVYHGGPGAERTPALVAAEAGHDALMGWFADLATQRRARPADDLVGALVTAEVDGDRLSDADVVGMCCVLLSAGSLTTTRLLGNLLHLLATDPLRWDQARRGADDRAALVEESLRLESPVQLPVRRTVVDVDVGGVTIPAGSTVMMGLGSANRDPVVHRDPDRFEPERDEAHLAFGHGVHFCLGAALARLEATTTLEALVERGRRPELAGPASREGGIAHRGFAELHLRLGVA